MDETNNRNTQQTSNIGFQDDSAERHNGGSADRLGHVHGGNQQKDRLIKQVDQSDFITDNFASSRKQYEDGCEGDCGQTCHVRGLAYET